MNNNYQDKLDEHIRNMNNVMFTFEVTKCCGYSTFITIYKQQTLLDLYRQILNHFQVLEIKELYFYAPSGQRIKVPISNQSVNEFIQKCITSNSVSLEPIYQLPRPVVYRLYLDDGNHSTHS